MSIYARASKAAWYEDRYLGARIEPDIGVFHTTETYVLPGYSGGATAPNYTVVPDFKRSRLKFYAHYSDERSSRALRNLVGGVETNTADVLQVELVGTCDPRRHAEWKRARKAHIFWPEAPEWALRDLAHFVADMNRRHKIPISGPSVWLNYGRDPRRKDGKTPASYGANGVRFSYAAWNKFSGWCGHQHVPENSHGDPGGFPWKKLAGYAKELLRPGAAVPPPPKKIVSPSWDALFEQADAMQRKLPASAHARRRALATVKQQAAKWSVRY